MPEIGAPQDRLDRFLGSFQRPVEATQEVIRATLPPSCGEDPGVEDSGWSATSWDTLGCGHNRTETILRFVKHDTGILYSGRDTLIAIPPRDPLGGYYPQIAVRAADVDSEATIALSPPFHKLTGVDIVTWTIQPVDSTQNLGFEMLVRFKTRIDSYDLGGYRYQPLEPYYWTGTMPGAEKRPRTPVFIQWQSKQTAIGHPTTPSSSKSGSFPEPGRIVEPTMA